MTAYHLKSWYKACGATQIDRIYVNADDRSSLGYIERRTTTAPRGQDTYYDRHRTAKGDTEAVVADKITFNVSDDVKAKLRTALAAQAGYEFLATNDDPMNFWQTALAFTRGIDTVYYSKAQERAAKKLIAAFTVEI